MAQTTRFASFGLVLVAVAHPNLHHAVETYIEPKKTSDSSKNDS
jgi:hypothetical protein